MVQFKRKAKRESAAPIRISAYLGHLDLLLSALPYYQGLTYNPLAAQLNQVHTENRLVSQKTIIIINLLNRLLFQEVRFQSNPVLIFCLFLMSCSQWLFLTFKSGLKAELRQRTAEVCIFVVITGRSGIWRYGKKLLSL